MRGKRLQREASLLLEIQTSATPAHVLCIHQACTSSILVWDQSEVTQTLSCVAGRCNQVFTCTYIRQCQ